VTIIPKGSPLSFNELSTFASGIITYNNKYLTGTISGHGEAQKNRFVVIDAVSHAIEFNHPWLEAASFSSVAMTTGTDGCVYMFPWTAAANCIIKYDPATQQTTKITGSTLNLEFNVAITHPNGFIYLFRWDSTATYYKYNIATATMQAITMPRSGTHASVYGTTARLDCLGRVCMLQTTSTEHNIIALDVESNTYTAYPVDYQYSLQTASAHSTNVGVNGNILIGPMQSNYKQLLAFNPYTNVGTTDQENFYQYTGLPVIMGKALVKDGSVVCITSTVAASTNTDFLIMHPDDIIDLPQYAYFNAYVK
jgi:hypothetical protein